MRLPNERRSAGETTLVFDLLTTHADAGESEVEIWLRARAHVHHDHHRHKRERSVNDGAKWSQSQGPRHRARLSAVIRFSRRRLLSLAAVLATRGAARAAPSDVVYLEPSDADYERRRQPFAKRIRHRPAVIAVCRSEAGVQGAIAEARRRKLPIALRSGGHSFEGFCINEGGLVLDLSELAGLSLAGGTLTAGPGARLGRVYDFLGARERWLPAGSCAGVGLGGLTLGGGYGFWSRELGLTCDSLTRVRVVDSAGAVHDSQSDPELLWACRGGGTASFGAVTHLELTTHPLPPKFATWRFRYKNLEPDKSVELAERWFTSMAHLPRTGFSAFVLHPHSAVILVTDSAGGAPAAVLDALGEDAAGPPETRTEPTPRAVKRFAAGLAPEYFKNVTAGYYDTFAELRDVLPRVLERMSRGPGMLFQINTMGGAISDPAREPTAAYPHRGASFLGELQSYYETPKREAAAHAAVRDIQALLATAGIHRHYSNYPDADLPDWATAYYGPSLDRLRAHFAPKMQATPDANAFAVVTQNIDSQGLAFRETAAKLASVSTLEAFMKDFKTKYTY